MRKCCLACTGQNPNSSILSQFSPSSICVATGRILVEPNLLISSDQKTDNRTTNMYALGDVAETEGPKMARAGGFQAEVVRNNIIASIQGKRLVDYKPTALEGAIKLSLGKVWHSFFTLQHYLAMRKCWLVVQDKCVMYMQDQSRDYLIPGKAGSIDLEVAKTWKMFGADMNEAATVWPKGGHYRCCVIEIEMWLLYPEGVMESMGTNAPIFRRPNSRPLFLAVQPASDKVIFLAIIK